MHHTIMIMILNIVGHLVMGRGAEISRERLFASIEYGIFQNHASSKGNQIFFPGMLPASKNQKKKKASVKIKREIY